MFRTFLSPEHCHLFNPRRCLSFTAPLYIRKMKPRPVLSKAALAAKERKRAQKIRKPLYELEKMSLLDAVNVLKAVEIANNCATYELVVKIAMKRGSTIPKGRFNLPREPKSKSKDRVFVFAEGKQAEEAKRAGAEFVGGPELIDGVANSRYPATMYLCTPALIRAITPRLGRILGPKGLMPSERRGTVTDDVGGFLKNLQGSSEWKGDKSGTIRTAVAKMDFPIEDVVKNVRHFLEIVKKSTSSTEDLSASKNVTKGNTRSDSNIFARVVLSSTQGPGIQVTDI